MFEISFTSTLSRSVCQSPTYSALVQIRIAIRPDPALNYYEFITKRDDSREPPASLLETPTISRTHAPSQFTNLNKALEE
ncbi:hypothetical protein N7527_004810 [Penicillium freii]|nr:hypothetical protein N7527_004810 [Penicillium freii]